MGKVGSSTVEGLVLNSYHTHTFYGMPPSFPYHLYKYGRLKILLRKYFVYPSKRLILYLNRKNVTIVTFFRDPVARDPSMFFQDLPYWLTYYMSKSGVKSRSEDPDFLRVAFKEIFPRDYPERWVRLELCRLAGIRYEDACLGGEPFKVIESGRFRVFIGRSEKMEECLKALIPYLNLSSKVVDEDKNRGSKKWYAQLYREFCLAAEDDIKDHCSKGFRDDNGYS
ncbi:hypothetical protein NCG89_11475 [Spongiibacter taiwanensis]|uniref:putative capsular polysaccharide synthesis family protein n=1 Tax=Spongiibacter taiwanensis TaxID=1748242 RepID=UPI002035084E|nr:putative capsular polysaccharide synthesis family protein [Spongiibacter taiwanensis]USA42141.1 hypothetical protein NCG89_11475 [Spongiibacter taiwanensis]